ncbi:MAG TPA: hypothetical protein IAC62_00735, partial [Candidatus Pelethocola excrementipullorum]|nr:hypothetical protein [Candidatus Pelethocola excrementipullorum]
DEIKSKLIDTLKTMSKYHLHILETGELETLLVDYGVKYKNKKEWIIEAINKVEELNKDDIKRESKLYGFLENIVT